MTKKPTLLGSIKAKLISATCMLLVAVIMVVSSTYAWFTLSTAPEVTGITTAVGANGALEIALWTGADPTTATTTTGTSADNVFWGNVVALNDNLTYGLDQITLYPSKLNEGTDGKLKSSILVTPEYGSDGRVSKLVEKIVTGVYTPASKSFYPGSNSYGVRAAGVSSGMTDRQLAFRNSISAGNTAMAAAKTLASQSLSANGSALSSIVVKKAQDSAAVYSTTDVANLQKIVNDLLAADGVLFQIESAYEHYIIAYAASTAVNNAFTSAEDPAAAAEVFYSTVSDWANEMTLYALVDKLAENGAAIPTAIQENIDALEAIRTKVVEAQTALNTMSTYTGDIAWADDTAAGTIGISTPLYKLANPDDMEVNGYKAGELMDNIEGFTATVLGGAGIVLTMKSGGGVYADVADYCGDYSASVTLEKIEYGGMAVSNVPARMETETTVETAYVTVFSSLVNTDAMRPTSTGGSDLPISEFYGYIVDLAFRTNASDSDLLLQVEGIDRIYKDNSADATTMGHGSSMTFKATTPNFTDDQVISLMECIRLVFFNTQTQEVYAYGKLDIERPTDKTVTGTIITADGIKANICLYEVATTTTDTYKVKAGTAEGTITYVDANNNDIYTVTTAASGAVTYTYKDAEQNEQTITIAADGAPTPEEQTTINGLAAQRVVTNTTTTKTEQKREDVVIESLTQNAILNLSTLVYLDGEAIQNKDVAATAMTSMTGSMNLQFSSSANLVPMKYADLYNPNTPAQGGGETPTP